MHVYTVIHDLVSRVIVARRHVVEVEKLCVCLRDNAERMSKQVATATRITVAMYAHLQGGWM